MDVLDMRGHSFIASKDTLASKILEEEDSLASLPTKKDSLASDSLAKDTTIHHRHDSLVKHKVIHGSDTLQFNQVKGKNMKGYFKDNKIYKVNVLGNAQTIYYVYTDNNKSIIGADRTDCSNMVLFIVKNKVNRITFLQKPDATLYPMKEVKPREFLLGGFHWYDDQRPRSIADIFRGGE